MTTRTNATIDIARLRTVVGAAARRTPELATRIDNAAAIIAARHVEHVHGDVWRVGSWAERTNEYYVCMETGHYACQCPDSHTRAPGGCCKHILAVAITEALTANDDSGDLVPPYPPAPARPRVPPGDGLPF